MNIYMNANMPQKIANFGPKMIRFKLIVYFAQWYSFSLHCPLSGIFHKYE
jgi:hypothetical protein